MEWEEATMPEAPELEQFRIDQPGNGVLHLVFDVPGRSMNVFSNAAIEELGKFADWLPQSDVAGVVIRSGKPSAFCAGADLAELETAYDMIMSASPAARERLAFDHFFKLSQGLRKLETAGKPVFVSGGDRAQRTASVALARHSRSGR
jgi:enoyl-CoA hydratase/carnithine racemase